MNPKKVCSQIIIIRITVLAKHLFVSVFITAVVVVRFRITAVWVFVVRTIRSFAQKGMELKFRDQLPELGQDGIRVQDVYALEKAESLKSSRGCAGLDVGIGRRRDPRLDKPQEPIGGYTAEV